MPTFDFLCESCGKSFEFTVKSLGKSRVSCPHCKGRKTRRLFSPFGISGKGMKPVTASGASCSTCGPRNCSTCG
ncbi:MAG: zinc ribbon domain-containing protein [Candidatus Eisenbacteria bacterium]|nr:zinc ribbon domain-containing protein [Candidatus Eisenbacteria bacterium]